MLSSGCMYFYSLGIAKLITFLMIGFFSAAPTSERKTPSPSSTYFLIVNVNPWCFARSLTLSSPIYVGPWAWGYAEVSVVGYRLSIIARDAWNHKFCWRHVTSTNNSQRWLYTYTQVESDTKDLGTRRNTYREILSSSPSTHSRWRKYPFRVLFRRIPRNVTMKLLIDSVRLRNVNWILCWVINVTQMFVVPSYFGTWMNARTGTFECQ